MKQVKQGKNSFSGEHYGKSLPRLEYIDVNWTMLDIKKLILKKVRYLFKDDNPVFKSDEELNRSIILHVADNLPYYIEGKYTKRKANCEFCRDRHIQTDTCDARIDKLSGNSDEGCR